MLSIDFGRMSLEEFQEYLEVIGEMSETEMIYLTEEEYIPAVLGIVYIEDVPYLTYSVSKIIKILRDGSELDEEDAMEYFDYNIMRGSEYSKANILYVY